MKTMITDIVDQMKESLLALVVHKIEVLEVKLFEKEKKNDILKKTVKTMENKLSKQIDEDRQHFRDLDSYTLHDAEKLNDAEQYGRRNNVRINGITEIREESANKTTKTVIDTINTKIEGLNLEESDIDIAHRLGKKTNAYQRQITVNCSSRLKREYLMTNRKALIGTHTFINEDLTKISQPVLMFLKKTMPDEVDSAWTRDGKLFYKTQLGNIHHVPYTEYTPWMDIV